ncbi:HD domain-containing protein [Candidatus Uhrbacteria bacterium]|nr:HD domain-containing protein [Candidatus Uhrbacteria bacterium]
MALALEHFSDIEQQEARLERALAAFRERDRERMHEALAFARTAHRGQQRKWQAVPYIIHPVRVAVSLVEELCVRDPDIIIAALLHDVVEDCDVPSDVVEQQFGRSVRRYVDALTWEPGHAVKWEQAQQQVCAEPAVRIVRTADVIDNCRDLATGCTADRATALRLIYGYAHWGMRIAERVSAEAVQLLTVAIASARTSCISAVPESPFNPNAGKSLMIEMSNVKCQMSNVARYPIRTHVIAATDSLLEIVRQYAISCFRPDDLLAISERIVAITQGRAFPIADIQPSAWAKFLVRFVHKSPYGIGLGSPWTMELAIREAGVPRILLAAVIAAITKPFGIRGMFYRVVGKHINAIDGPCDYTIPLASGERYAKLGPKDPDGVATSLAREIGVDVAIIDANDIGVNVLGVSEGVDRSFVRAAFRDNPLGQSNEQTPLAIVREASDGENPKS